MGVKLRFIMQDRDRNQEEDVALEIGRLERTSRAVDDLRNKSIGRFLSADSVDAAKQSLYEVYFLEIAGNQSDQQAARLKGERTVDDLALSDVSLASKEMLSDLDAISEIGWVNIKISVGHTFFENYKNEVRWSNSFEDLQESFGVSPDFSFEGVPLFRRSPLIWPKFQIDKFGKLLERQLSLILDGPDDWRYSNLPALQRAVEEAGISELPDEDPGFSQNP